MACPALPLCGLAVTEAERSLPDITRRLRELLNGLGLDDLESLVVRMTGAWASRALSRSRAPRDTSYSEKLGPFGELGVCGCPAKLPPLSQFA